jgi:hypothetical protein
MVAVTAARRRSPSADTSDTSDWRGSSSPCETCVWNSYVSDHGFRRDTKGGAEDWAEHRAGRS